MKKIELENVRRLNVKPGDIIVLTVTREEDIDTRGKIRERVRALFNYKVECIVIKPGDSLSVLRYEDHDDTVQLMQEISDVSKESGFPG